MLTAFLHRKRKAAEAALTASRRTSKGAGEALELTREVYGTRLLVRGLLWGSIYLLARGLLELTTLTPPMRVAVALLPLPFFVWYLWTWTRGVGEMDELQRRIELEALGFAFPATLVLLMTVGLLDLAVALDAEYFSLHHIWLMLPVLYYIGLWRAKRRYL